MNNITKKWISAVLCNDETSTNQEMIEYFISEGKLSHAEAVICVSHREDFLKTY